MTVCRSRAAVALALIALASQTFAVDVNVDVAATRHAIDPRIYGAAWANATQIAQLGLTLNRWGGNAVSRYNWSISTANRCKDYYFFNIPETPTPPPNPPPGWNSADDFIEDTRNAGAEPVMTIPMLSLLPEDATKQCSFPEADYALQEQYSNPAWEPISCGNGRYEDGNGIIGDGPRILGVADPNNISTSYLLSHQGDWVQHMIDTWGSAAAGGVKYYSLDNEPSLWSFDHWDVHPAGQTYDELWGKMEELGAIIRAKDPAAVITGGEEWGWSGFFQSGLDQENWNNANANADRLAHDDKAHIDWLLDQAKDYEDANATRILDVLAVHFYPQNGEFWSGRVDDEMKAYRNRSTRALWDPDYVDESWIADTGIDGGKVRLIPRLKEWVANHYPGTLSGITEYNWGDGDPAFGTDNINYGTAQADILGIFGREDLDIGIRWTAPAVNSFVGSAFKIYRNYDGAGAKFGETSISTTVPDPDTIAAFASQRTADSAVTVVLINKNLAGSHAVTVNLSNFGNSGAAERWQLTSASATIQHLSDLTASGSSVSTTLPAQSVTLLVIPPQVVAPPTVTATATSASQVALSWTPVASAVSYEVRRSFNGSAFSILTTLATTSTNDSGLTADTTYLYKVRAVFAAGSTELSATDHATTTVFTDDPLNAGTAIKTAHVSQLRTAVNAMRASAGLAPQIFAEDPVTTSTTIQATHVNQLRIALDEARAAIGVPALVYTDDPVTTATTIKAAHINEFRDGVK
jgi:hypothetical protein